MRIQNAEALRLIIAAQRKAVRETRGWERLLPTAKYVILAESAANGLTITSALTPQIQRFLNAHNATVLQEDCALTYAGHNTHLTKSFCQDLLQGHILAIPDTDDPT